MQASVTFRVTDPATACADWLERRSSLSLAWGQTTQVAAAARTLNLLR